MSADRVVLAAVVVALIAVLGAAVMVLMFLVPGLAIGCLFPEDLHGVMSNRVLEDGVPKPGEALLKFVLPSWGSQNNPLESGYFGCVRSQWWDVLLTVTDFHVFMAAVLIPMKLMIEITTAAYRMFKGRA